MSNQITAELTTDGDYINLSFDYNPVTIKKVKKVPGYRFIASAKLWRVNLDLPTCRKLREEFGDDLELGPRLRGWGREAVAKESKLTDLSQADDAELDHADLQRLVKGCKTPDGKTFKLRPYQKADIKFMASTNAINANQPRTGKTITTIGAILESDLAWGQHLIGAPIASLRNVWETGIKEAYKCAGLDEPVVLTGDTPKERKAAIAEAKQMADDGLAFWLVLNPAMMRMKTRVEGKGDQAKRVEELAHPELAEIDWDSMTIDEFHLMGLSNPATLGARGVMDIAMTTQPVKRYALSGTPMGGKPIKLWGALRFLNPNEFTSRWNWAKHWLIINNNGYGSSIEGIMPGREVDFYNHLKPYLVRRTQKEALPGLPPTNRVDVWCQMTLKQAEQYAQFATEAEWRIDDAEAEGRLTATNILSEYLRLKQFANAFCKVQKTGREVKGVDQLEVLPTEDSGKLIQLVEKLQEVNVIGTSKEMDEDLKCAVVFSQFNGMVKMVADHLNSIGVPAATITGATTGTRRTELVRQFQEQSEGAPRVLVMNTMAGGSAITLDRAETVHMLDETWVPDNQEQAENRITPTTAERMKRLDIGVYYYRSRGSIEEYIKKLVADKQLNNKTILDLRRRMQKDLAEAEALRDAGL